MIDVNASHLYRIDDGKHTNITKKFIDKVKRNTKRLFKDILDLYV